LPSDFTTDNELNKRLQRLVQFCGKEIADIVGDLIEEKKEKLDNSRFETPPQEMVTNIMSMTMQFTFMLNEETLKILANAIEIDPNCGMQFGRIADKEDKFPWRRDYKKDESH